MIKRIEEVSINAWPSLQTSIYDGWIIRFADGYTKRANSINPLYYSKEEIDKKIDYCEILFKNKNLPVVFKLTKESEPVGLDDKLALRGYEKIDVTSVQMLELVDFKYIQLNNCVAATKLTDDWLNAFSRFSKLSEKQRCTLKKMLLNRTMNNYYFKYLDNDSIIACGLGVEENKYFGLFDVVVDEKHRGKGHGRKLLDSILSFAKSKNIEKAYLQVVGNNVIAKKLYKNIGFKEIYKYWYRIKKI